MTLPLTLESFSDAGLASGDPDGRPARPHRHVWIGGQDVVYAEELAGPPVTFALESRAELMGWKGLVFVAADGRVLGEVEVGDGQHGPVSLTVPPSALDGGRLVFRKATLMGDRADVYHLDTTGLPGGLRFYWSRDSR